MGLFDPSKDKDIKPDDHIVTPPSSSLSSINSSSISKPPDQLDESLKSIITATNDITSNSISNLLDWSNKLIDNEFFNYNNQESPLSSSSSSSSSLFKLSDYLFGDLNDDRFFNKINKRFNTNKSSPYGYWSYPVPSSSLYQNCLDKDGLSAWDSNGYWRCLFPRAIIPDDGNGSEVLSKEDVLNDVDHSKGLFFESFTDYLGFKNKMNEIVKKQKMEKWMKFKDEQKNKWDFLKSKSSTNDDYDGSLVQNDVSTYVTNDRGFATNRRIRGSSSSTSIKTLENGDIEKFTVLKQLYDDGSSEVSEFKEILNQNGERKSFDENIKKYPKKGGWFWDSSDKS